MAPPSGMAEFDRIAVGGSDLLVSFTGREISHPDPEFAAGEFALVGDAGLPVDRESAKDLVSRLPANANALIVLDANKVLRSPLAQKEGWRERREKAFAAGVTILPPDTNEFVLAAELDPARQQGTSESAARMTEVARGAKCGGRDRRSAAWSTESSAARSAAPRRSSWPSRKVNAAPQMPPDTPTST